MGTSYPYYLELEPLFNHTKKFKAVFYDVNMNKLKTIRFGASGYSDYTKHKDPARKESYLARHRVREDWDNPMTAGSLSRYILWGEPTLGASIDVFLDMFDLYLVDNDLLNDMLLEEEKEL